MKFLNPFLHGVLDYAVVIVFALAPSVFHFGGAPAVISYILAGVHLVLTALTAFSPGVIKAIPLAIHGWIELVVSICLIALPLGAGFIGSARNFYLAVGAVIFFVWLFTKYQTAEKPAV